jgi:prolyl-tRNA synthetase
MLVRRDNGQKTPASLDGLAATVKTALETIQSDLYSRAKEFREKHSQPVDDYGRFNPILDGEAGFLWSHWCGSADCEEQVKNETKATIRCIPMNQPPEAGKCIVCGAASEGRVIFARAY